MLDLPFDLLPKPAIPALLGTAFLSYFVAGPEIATRVARVDFLPACEREVATSIRAEASAHGATIGNPPADPAKDVAAGLLRQLAGSPLAAEMRQNPLGRLALGTVTGAVSTYEHGKAEAEIVARSARERLDALTATRLARTGSVCDCLADRAIAETRIDWAIFAGTLGLVRSARITAFGDTMRRSDPDGTCRKEVRP